MTCSALFEVMVIEYSNMFCNNKVISEFYVHCSLFCVLYFLKMDLDSESTATSIDENTENFCENPTRDTLAEGLMGLIKPTVDQLDERVRATRLETRFDNSS